MAATNYPLVDVFISTLYFSLLILWIILVFHVFADVFRSHDLSGAAKASWVLFVVVLPLVGCLVYVLARGARMHERTTLTTQASPAALEDYIRRIARTKE